MVFLYNSSIFLLRVGIWVAAFFNDKARMFYNGRRGLMPKIEKDFQSNTDPVIWIHCASLGEFEQGRPVIERLKEELPQIRILLTFFSPSGYEVRKNYSEADFIYYLPLDTASKARQFVALTKPSLAVFVKYEFWYHFTSQLRKQKIPLVSISAIFRPEQIYFKSYGSFYQRILKNFTHFFVQNDTSLRLLQSIGLTNVTRAGDTRFDRVNQIVKRGEKIPLAETFKNNQRLMVVGSCWPEDMDVLAPFVNENRLKFIIAPHEISESALENLERLLQVRYVRYSEAQHVALEEFSVLIIDNVGMLSRLYRYGEFAYVGGAFGAGLHNILEAACYGVPIFFGNKNFEKFQEATDLINRGGAFEVSDYTDLKSKYEMLNIPESFLLACEVTRQYVQENLGATEKIMSYCRTLSPQQ